MYKACIFDLDGTLANTLDSIAYFGNQALKHYGYPEIEAKEYRYMVGNGAKELVRRMLAKVGDTSEETFLKVSVLYNQTYNNDYLYLTAVYDGIPELLAGLKQRGFKIGVLSNKPDGTTQKVITALFGKGYFDTCYGQRDNVPKKPDPAALMDILEEWGIAPNECLYVGDTSTDMQTGKNANLFTIGVLWGFRDRAELEEHRADLIVSVPREILDHIDGYQTQ